MRLTLPHHAEAGQSPLELDSSRRAGVKPAELEHAITQRTVVFAGEATSKPLEPKLATVARNALVMHVYSLVFDWCTDVINAYIASVRARPRPTRSQLSSEGARIASALNVRTCASQRDAYVCTGVLDIFGFENFSSNNFPQLCINFPNESLHNRFIEHVFKLEQEVYIAEEVEWNFVSYEDNQPACQLHQNSVRTL